jgi:hypothetical protein
VLATVQRRLYGRERRGFDVAGADDVVATATKVGRDAVYLVVGTGVLAFQRLQVERREVESKVRSLFG